MRGVPLIILVIIFITTSQGINGQSIRNDLQYKEEVVLSFSLSREYQDANGRWLIRGEQLIHIEQHNLGETAVLMKLNDLDNKRQEIVVTFVHSYGVPQVKPTSVNLRKNNNNACYDYDLEILTETCFDGNSCPDNVLIKKVTVSRKDRIKRKNKTIDVHFGSLMPPYATSCESSPSLYLTGNNICRVVTTK